MTKIITVLIIAGLISCSKQNDVVTPRLSATEYIDSIVNGKVLKTHVSLHYHEKIDNRGGYHRDSIIKFAAQFPTTRYVVCAPLNQYGRMVVKQDTCK